MCAEILRVCLSFVSYSAIDRVACRFTQQLVSELRFGVQRSWLLVKIVDTNVIAKEERIGNWLIQGRCDTGGETATSRLINRTSRLIPVCGRISNKNRASALSTSTAGVGRQRVGQQGCVSPNQQ